MAAEMRVRFTVESAKQRLALTFRERLAEWSEATALTLWGVLVLGSPGLFERPYYQPVARLMTQNHAGTLATAIGMFHVAWLGINGLYRPSANWRALCSSLGSMFWLLLLVGAVSVEWRSPGAGLYGVFFAIAVMSSWFAAGDYHRKSYTRPYSDTGSEYAGASS